MYKFIFNLLIDPLVLPISPVWEYAILFLIGVLSFIIAFKISPGGVFGSEIHWIVRIAVYIILWASVNGFTVAIQWMISHWVLSFIIIGGVLFAIGLITAAILYHKNRGEKPIKKHTYKK